MLALLFTETGLHLDLCQGSLEDWLIFRILLAQTLSEPIYLEMSWASLLLPDDLPDIQQANASEDIELCQCDIDWVEVSLEGIWLSCDPDGIEGALVTELDSETELMLYTLWQASKSLLMA